MRRMLLILSAATLLGSLTGCHVTTGICDCDCLPPPVIHPTPPPPPPAKPAVPMLPGGPPAAVALPPEGIRVVPMTEPAPVPDKLPNR